MALYKVSWDSIVALKILNNQILWSVENRKIFTTDTFVLVSLENCHSSFSWRMFGMPDKTECSASGLQIACYILLQKGFMNLNVTNT